ncbi:Hemin transport system permease protein HmuU [Sporomusa rhizae]|uniref:FecCD family ABC transporter permease n=1 Tax=Sporomusa rhizae TaxID=357999 RepID=UPI00352BB206
MHKGNTQLQYGGIIQKNTRKLPLIVTVTFLLLFLLISITLGIMIGPVKIEPHLIWRIALVKAAILETWINPDWTSVQENIVWHIRVPRVLLGAVVGAGLSVTGVAIQALVRNPLADPYILGVSSGASVMATLVILFGLFGALGQFALSMGAFLGALLSVITVYVLARVGGRISSTKLLLSGVALSLMLNAATNLIVMMAPREMGIRSALFWIMGSLAGAKWSYLIIPAFIVTIGTIFLLCYHRPLNALLLGDEAAVTLGVDVDKLRKLLVVISSLIAGAVVAVSGAIGFIGLMIPHIARILVGSEHRRVLPVSILLGSSFTIWADVFARMALSPEELPLGVITALLGGPFFIWILQKNGQYCGG